VPVRFALEPKVLIAVLIEEGFFGLSSLEGDELSVDSPVPLSVLQEGAVCFSNSNNSAVLHFNGNHVVPDVDEFTGHELLDLLLGSRQIILRQNDRILPLDDKIDKCNVTIQIWSQSEPTTTSLSSCSACSKMEQRMEQLERKLVISSIKQLEPIHEIRKKFNATPLVLDAPGLTMHVSEKVTPTKQVFSITNPLLEKVVDLNSVIEMDDIRSPVFELGPHKVDFVVPVELNFKVAKKGAKKPALFIQEDDESREIGALLRVPTIVREDPGEWMLSLKAKRFSIAFVADDVGIIQATTGPTTTTSPADAIVSGINCRGKCATSGCASKGQYVTCNLGYKDSWHPLSAADNALIVCPTCSQKMEARQVLFCNARYKVTWSLRASGANQPPKEVENEVNGDMLGVIGNPAAARAARYSYFEVVCKKAFYNVAVGNNNVNEDAAADGAFQGKTVLIANFAEAENSVNLFDSGPGAALKRKGFTYKLVKTELEFAQLLPSYDVGWIISYLQSVNNSQELLAACRTHHNKGKGLYILGDNDPCNNHANAVLPSLFGFSLKGNTPADKTLSLSYTLGKGTFLPSHIITTGISTMYEGVTICYPSQIPSNFHVLGHSTDGHPCILYADEDKAANKGRVVIDCGWTKLCYKWDAVGTARYISNAACWLAGYDTSSHYYLLQ
jgi:hypothetical protein